MHAFLRAVTIPDRAKKSAEKAKQNMSRVVNFPEWIR